MMLKFKECRAHLNAIYHDKGNKLYLNQIQHRKKKEIRRKQLLDKNNYREDFEEDFNLTPANELGVSYPESLKNSKVERLRESNSLRNTAGINQSDNHTKKGFTYQEVVPIEEEDFKRSNSGKKSLDPNELKGVYAEERGENTQANEKKLNDTAYEIPKKIDTYSDHDDQEPYIDMSNEVDLKKRFKDRFKNLDLIDPNKDINTQEILIENIRNGEYAFYCVCLLNVIEDRYILPRNVEKLCKTAMVLVRDEEGLTRSRHPILLCALIAELLNRLAKAHTKFQYKCVSVSSHILEVAESIQNSIKDEVTLNYYIREQMDHTGRSALEIVSQNLFFNLLSDDNVGSIVTKMWYGDNQTLGFGRFSHIQKFTFSSVNQGTFDFIKEEVSKERAKNFSFQYQSFISNCSVRFLVDSISTITATLLYQIIIYLFVQIHKYGDIDLFSDTDVFFNVDYAEIEAPVLDYKIQYEPLDNAMFKSLSYIASIVAFSITCNFVSSIYFSIKANIKVKLSAWVMIDVIMFLAVLFNFLEYPKIMTDDKLEQKNIFAINYSIIIVFAWARVVAIIMRTKTFGPFLRIVYMLTGLIFNFIIIYFCINMMFAQFFTVFFYKITENYERIWQSWQTLFEATFAVYDFDVFDDNHPLLGSFFLVVYITLTNTMLLNLIIAILNNQFVIHSKTADAENRAILVVAYEKIKWNKEWGLLILLPAPLNLISLPFVVIHSIFVPDKYREYFNSIFCKTCYMSIALFYFFYLLVISVVFYPFALLRSYYHTLYDSYKHSNEFSFNFFEFLLRPLTFLGYILIDMRDFWLMAYRSDEKEKKTEKIMQTIEMELIYNIRNFLIEFKRKYKKRVISINEMLQKMRITEALIKRKEKSNNESNNYEDKTANSKNSTNMLSSPRKSGDSFLFRGMDKKEKFRKAKAYRYLILKLADKDNFIDIERALIIMPESIRLTDDYFKWIRILNLKRIIRGLQNHFFNNTIYNPMFFYKKLNQLLSKINIKMLLLTENIPQNIAVNLNKRMKEVNVEFEENKNQDINAFEEEQDDDEEEGEEEIKQLSKNNYSQKSIEEQSFAKSADIASN